MAVLYIKGHCKECNKAGKLQRNSTNNILHLLLSIVSGGLWLPIWLIVALKNAKKWQCEECGSREVTYKNQ